MHKATFMFALVVGCAVAPTGWLLAGMDDKKSEAAEKLLKEKGLTRNDRKFLIEEDERAVIDKYDQAKSAKADLQKAMTRYAGILQFDESVQAIEFQRQGLQQEINTLQMQLNSTPYSSNGRMRAMQNSAQAPLRQQQNADRAVMNQLSGQAQALKSQGPKAEDRRAATAEYDKTRKGYVDSVRDLEEALTPLLEKYHELGSDKAVKDALADIWHATQKNVKLGPSDQVLAASKLVQEMKKAKALPMSKPATKKKAKSAASKSVG
jgi:hypothetical protein